MAGYPWYHPINLLQTSRKKPLQPPRFPKHRCKWSEDEYWNQKHRHVCTKVWRQLPLTFFQFLESTKKRVPCEHTGERDQIQKLFFGNTCRTALGSYFNLRSQTLIELTKLRFFEQCCGLVGHGCQIIIRILNNNIWLQRDVFKNVRKWAFNMGSLAASTTEQGVLIQCVPYVSKIHKELVHRAWFPIFRLSLLLTLDLYIW